MRGSAILLVAGLSFACREAPGPFENQPDDWSGEPPLQLTYSTNTDLTPVWSRGGDSIYYATAALPGIDESSRGIILRVPAEGGPASILLPALQQDVAIQRWLLLPALSPSGDRIAFVELYELFDPPNCAVLCPGVMGAIDPLWPQLDSARVRVFSIDGGQIVGSVTIRFAGKSIDPTRTAPGVDFVSIYENLPFQALWREYRIPLFRPSWSPDGTRIVFSDGTRLLLWTVGQPAAQEIPGTLDGNFPAWSPDGQNIAYSTLPRGNAVTRLCRCVGNRGDLIELHEQVQYTGTYDAGVLTVIRPDGSNKRILGEGDAPAWTPGGQLIFHRDSELWRSNTDGSALVRIPNTYLASFPAVSPDGSKLAFAISTDGERNYDLWVMPLSVTQ